MPSTASRSRSQRGEMLALVGESGCGKTTTAQAVLRLRRSGLRARSASTGEDITRPRRRRAAAAAPARCRSSTRIPYESLDPRLRVRAAVEEPLLIHRLGGSKAERAQRVLEALARVELSPPELFVDRYPHELSGGQRQRVAIAAALVLEPQLLVADEPVSMLDVSVRAGVLKLLDGLAARAVSAILMITHDLSTAARFADRIAVMYLGRIVEQGPAREVVRNPQHPYTKALLSVVPHRDPRKQTQPRDPPRRDVRRDRVGRVHAPALHPCAHVRRAHVDRLGGREHPRWHGEVALPRVAVGFAVKVPLFPFHTWLPDAHTDAPTAGSVVLAGVMLKIGAYGFLRFAIPFFPQAAVDLAPMLIVLAVIGITYGAIVAAMQPNLKRIVAYSSVAHLGFVVLGVFALTNQGISGGLFTMLSHGLTTGALFLLVGMLYDRRHTYELSKLPRASGRRRRCSAASSSRRRSRRSGCPASRDSSASSCRCSARSSRVAGTCRRGDRRDPRRGLPAVGGAARVHR